MVVQDKPVLVVWLDTELLTIQDTEVAYRVNHWVALAAVEVDAVVVLAAVEVASVTVVAVPFAVNTVEMAYTAAVSVFAAAVALQAVAVTDNSVATVVPDTVDTAAGSLVVANLALSQWEHLINQSLASVVAVVVVVVFEAVVDVADKAVVGAGKLVAAFAAILAPAAAFGVDFVESVHNPLLSN